ncbi:hypothetical protein TMatcc_008487 [Talaromyces marneffei ATCC 18224]|uniref:uncharacterized protein n=1 Tax=Talaromyces marneffei TaxID=37727 RepID=UPI0012A98C93|nr:uncharacterized protein EYB26_007822 [Talaromyces marneffei]KAE8550454.1 hypothetical protein EYB25_006681 [Talaromyces marneffei]QGA20121.1 hypothetical protein EYB26_007822 [Talaromyces marneffei]
MVQVQDFQRNYQDDRTLIVFVTIADAQLKNAGNHIVSAVVKINGIDATDYLEAHAALGIDAHDPDARYNRLFPDPVAAISQQWPLGDWARNKGMWPGAATFLLQFANGSTRSLEITATWPTASGKMNHTAGGSLYEAFCDATLPANAVHDSPAIPPKYKEPTIKSPPIMGHYDNLMFGYYLDGIGLDDVAVLQLPTFQSTKLDTKSPNVTTISETAAIFIQRAVSDRKIRMIVDVSSNGGGDLIQGFRLASIFFPDKPIYTTTRFRATELVDLMGRVYNRTVEMDATADMDFDPSLVAQWMVSPDQRSNFQSWGDLYGPHQVMNSNMSTLHARFNFSQRLETNRSMELQQSGPDTTGGTGAFAPKNIIIVMLTFYSYFRRFG